MVRVDVPTERYVHPLPPNTASRFVETVPRYRVDWIVLSYSKAAIGTFVLISLPGTGADGQSGAPFILMPSGASLAHRAALIC